MEAEAGQGEGDQRVAGRGAGFAMAASGDQDKLATLLEIARRGGDAGGGQAASPQLDATLRVEGAQIVVERGADEDQAARGGEGAAEGCRASPPR